MMKILLVYGKGNMGGIQVIHTILCRELRKLGHDARLFFFKGGDYSASLESEVPVYLGNLSTLIQLVLDESFDVVQGAVWDLHLGLDVLKQLDPAPKVVMTYHGSLCAGWSDKNADALIACAGWLKDKADAITNLDVDVILNGMNFDDFEFYRGKYEGPEIIAWINHLAQKRIDRLAKLAPGLKEHGVQLHVISSDPLEQVACSNSRVTLEKTVDKWHSLTRQEMPSMYNRVAASGGIVLVTSDWEGLAAVPTEAQASGCVVIGTNVQGVNENVRPEYGGVLYNKDMNTDELVSLITKVISDKDLLREKAEKANRFVRETFSIDRFVKQHLAIYERLEISKPRPLPLRMSLFRLRHFPPKHERELELKGRRSIISYLQSIGQNRAVDYMQKSISPVRYFTGRI